MGAMYGTVVSIEQLAPRMMRVVLGGEGLDSFEPVPFTDQYVNALFLPEGAPWSMPFDAEEVRSGPPEFAPRGRRETVRRWDAEAREMCLDVVTHGDEGYAGRWVQRAREGDRLQITGPGGGYIPGLAADWHLLVGDESALPAIAASLEVIPAGSPVRVVAVVDAPGHEIELIGPADAEVVWVYRQDHTGDPNALLDAVAGLTFPAGDPHVFVHGEAGEVRSIRRHLIGERGVSKEGQSISPYWRRAHTDEQWRAVKKEWIAAAGSDV